MEKIVFSLNENFMMDYKVVTKKKRPKKKRITNDFRNY